MNGFERRGVPARNAEPLPRASRLTSKIGVVAGGRSWPFMPRDRLLDPIAVGGKGNRLRAAAEPDEGDAIGPDRRSRKRSIVP